MEGGGVYSCIACLSHLIIVHDVLVYLGHGDYSSGCNLIFAESRFSGEVWSSLSEEPQKIQGEALLW